MAPGTPPARDDEARPARELLTVKQAALRFDISRRTIFRFLADGSLRRFSQRGSRDTFIDAAELSEVRRFRER